MAEHLGAFERLLNEQGYARESVRRHLRLIADFSLWLKHKKMSIEEVTHEIAERYLHYRAHHRCPRKGARYALRRFVQLLQENGSLAKEAPVAQTPVEKLVDEYSLYLHQERGLAATTIRRYRWCVRLFLMKQFGDGAARLSDLRAQEIISFVQNEAVQCPTRAQSMAKVLRSFLQYARYRGSIKLDLAGVIPWVAHWSMASIPRAISPEYASRALASCDRRRPVGRRDYAILLLLARLGLRSGEVVSLTLDDIDWETGTLNIHGKGGQESSLPLVAPVGKAIVDYLKNGRAYSESRSLFLRINAPIRGFKTEKAVRNVVQYALERAGIDSPRKGAHQFRHALATQMLRQGSSLAEISEVLRHKNPESTRIYAKVDLDSLRTLALPWPSTRP
ncbi:site-specific integrase [Cupriavidus consociatus]|uniref:site-specific integrase n=1 Tax=Cupriavidus consociatus TaxID=2821357 RepID=UPI001AEA8793|nr:MULTISPECIES: site-specific integrase [unclassified Cupriavidus]MBP0625396.1 tyrosine-type recombinase/integrase [Cupriavidus sp. LEh25]MDK2662138.1 site-specific integrase [Cupriavidus sp. LEh21]